MKQAFKICDNGIGFDQNDAQRIFNVFTKLHGNKNIQDISHSITKKVVENHHGYIYANGGRDKGACLSILLRCKEADFVYGSLRLINLHIVY